jgi:hypothetical protein
MFECDPIEDLPGYPTEYARFVYCLSYGESEMLIHNRPVKNSGTRQYWEMFYSCLHEIDTRVAFLGLHKKIPFQQRIQNKISLLKKLKNSGIWLVDASIVALYNQGTKPALTTMNEILSESWNGYTYGRIEKENPARIICIGKGVANVVEVRAKKLVGDKNFSIIPQPNSYRTSAERLSDFREYWRICSPYFKQ